MSGQASQMLAAMGTSVGPLKQIAEESIKLGELAFGNHLAAKPNVALQAPQELWAGILEHILHALDSREAQLLLAAAPGAASTTRAVGWLTGALRAGSSSLASGACSMLSLA